MKEMRHIVNWVNGREEEAASGEWLDKYNPHTGSIEARFSGSSRADVQKAISVARKEYEEWSNLTPVARGNAIGAWVRQLRNHKEELSETVSRETGKPLKDAEGEVNAALAQGEFFAGEGMRMYANSLTSAMPGKYVHTVRQPLGVAGLIVPANTPIANIAWKIFPALVCGNTAVLKASEDAPEIALRMGQLARQAELPDGVFNVIQGSGDPAGRELVENNDIAVISFTGSTAVGRVIAQNAGARLARVSLELGGKNPFVVCDDADIDEAVKWAMLSAFSNAGQRCASGSRILVFAGIYDEFVNELVRNTKKLKLGVDNNCDLGPVINSRQHKNILDSIEKAVSGGGELLCGGKPPEDEDLRNGFYIQPTLISNLPENAELCTQETFGPVASVHVVKDIYDALRLSNRTDYGLTAAIHTRNVDRAIWYAQAVRSGTVNVNIGTFGSEPHMPFGGFGASGNGTREPGVEALDVYSEKKNISVLVRNKNI